MRSCRYYENRRTRCWTKTDVHHPHEADRRDARAVVLAATAVGPRVIGLAQGDRGPETRGITRNGTGKDEIDAEVVATDTERSQRIEARRGTSSIRKSVTVGYTKCARSHQKNRIHPKPASTLAPIRKRT